MIVDCNYLAVISHTNTRAIDDCSQHLSGFYYAFVYAFIISIEGLNLKPLSEGLWLIVFNDSKK